MNITQTCGECAIWQMLLPFANTSSSIQTWVKDPAQQPRQSLPKIDPQLFLPAAVLVLPTACREIDTTQGPSKKLQTQGQGDAPEVRRPESICAGQGPESAPTNPCICRDTRESLLSAWACNRHFETFARKLAEAQIRGVCSREQPSDQLRSNPTTCRQHRLRRRLSANG